MHEKKIEVGKIYTWNEIQQSKTSYIKDNYDVLSVLDDGRDIFFQKGKYGILGTVMGYWEGGKDDPNPRIRVLSIWTRQKRKERGEER